MKNLSLVLVFFLLFNYGCRKDLNNPVAPDNSNGWTQTNVPGLDGGLVTNGANLFAGSRTSGVFRSSDDGSSWTPIDSGLNAKGVTSLAASGTNLFAGTASAAGVFRSSNQGVSWIAIDSGLT
ncbi:MAG: regulator, partial [Bacteroidota bacterium]